MKKVYIGIISILCHGMYSTPIKLLSPDILKKRLSKKFEFLIQTTQLVSSLAGKELEKNAIDEIVDSALEQCPECNHQMKDLIHVFGFKEMLLHDLLEDPDESKNT